MSEPRPKRPERKPAPRGRGASDEGMRRGGGLRRLPDLLGRVLDPAVRRRGLAEARLLTEWSTIVGPDLAARSQPVRLSHRRESGGVLSLHVAGTAALEFQHSEPQMLERINGFFGYPAVMRLHLIQAPMRRTVNCPAPTEGVSLTEAEENEVADAVHGVGDSTLQAALVALGRTLKRRGDECESGLTGTARSTRPNVAG